MSIHKKINIIISLICLAYFCGCQQEQTMQACFKENCFFIETASTPQERAKGLMYKREMDHNRGMLFVFELEGDYAFFMKNTYIPLDILWINSNKEVVYVKKNAQPCRRKPCENFESPRKAKYVLELNAGTVDNTDIKIGDKVRFKKVRGGG